MASKTMKTLMQFTNEKLLAELTNLKEHECTQYTDGGLNRLLARLKKWRVDTLADIVEQETIQGTIMAGKKTKKAKDGLVTSSNKMVAILHDDLVENDLKFGWITASLDASDARAHGQPTKAMTGGGRTLFGTGFKSVAGPTDAAAVAGPTDHATDEGPTDAGQTDAGPTDAGPTDAGQTDEGDDDDDGGQSDNATATNPLVKTYTPSMYVLVQAADRPWRAPAGAT